LHFDQFYTKWLTQIEFIVYIAHVFIQRLEIGCNGHKKIIVDIDIK